MENSISEKIDKMMHILVTLEHRVGELESLVMDRSYLRPSFVESSPAQRSFVTLVDRILDNILQSGFKKAEMWIMGYFDQARIDKLKPILEKGTKVKIISPELNLSKSQDKSNLDALKRMKKYGAEVRIHPMLHARIFYIERDGSSEVVIGSGDIKSDCLGGKRFDAGIRSNHPEIIADTIGFFSRVWNDDGAIELSEIGKK
jgi:hypothetical protein